MNSSRSVFLGIVALTVFGEASIAAPNFPPGFSYEVVTDDLSFPVDMAFAPDGRIFVAEKRGTVKVVENGAVLPTPFIDLREEVNNANDRGLLGLALDPEFENTPWVYLLYVVDPIFGSPNEPGTEPAMGRLVRYLADPATNGNTAISESRQVILGNDATDAFIHCFSSHAIGTLRFANDGSLFVGAGDGAHFNLVDAGGEHPDCFMPPLFDSTHDVGAFRAQHLGSMAGKIFRINPDTGEGMTGNPFWTGDGDDVASRVWVSGLRNPFRFALRSDTGTPETLYIGDVGWNAQEEINVAHGGENFGWPCYEGPGLHSQYFNAQPAHSGCATIETPDNPGPLTPPLVWWHHQEADDSFPTGVTGRCTAGGAFYTGHCYPPEYQGKFFYADYTFNWMRVLDVDEQDAYVGSEPFGTGLDRPVDIEAHPDSGDIYFISILLGEVRRIRYQQQPADADWDCDVDVADFGEFQSCFAGSGQAVGVRCLIFDHDDDGDVDLADFEDFAERQTGPL